MHACPHSRHSYSQSIDAHSPAHPSLSTVYFDFNLHEPVAASSTQVFEYSHDENTSYISIYKIVDGPLPTEISITGDAISLVGRILEPDPTEEYDSSDYDSDDDISSDEEYVINEWQYEEY